MFSYLIIRSLLQTQIIHQLLLNLAGWWAMSAQQIHCVLNEMVAGQWPIVSDSDIEGGDDCHYDYMLTISNEEKVQK